MKQTFQTYGESPLGCTNVADLKYEGYQLITGELIEQMWKHQGAFNCQLQRGKNSRHANQNNLVFTL